MFRHSFALDQYQFSSKAVKDSKDSRPATRPADDDVNSFDEGTTSSCDIPDKKSMNFERSVKEKDLSKRKKKKKVVPAEAAGAQKRSEKKKPASFPSSKGAKSTRSPKKEKKVQQIQSVAKLKAKDVKKPTPNTGSSKTYSKRALQKFEREFMPASTSAGKERQRKLNRAQNHESS